MRIRWKRSGRSRQNVGMAFQIQDDILDVIGDEAAARKADEER